ncbi:putative Fe-S protein YdhL (DUF1289 family) [Pelomonas saccharophila]|uniref:Fe-S protein YdhL (DUF1289 family) n=1 Tax=Roseateles saccharophilus TaxID=304 RepID=A0ABU1YTV7_ROSSA|nr:DUF3717 domain-containing protein [Roseateles saccharophilus]MDR7272303.1 putative Fe-S protein YdhL (DUF1289 family) [Roseateles saccharophilus]
MSSSIHVTDLEAAINWWRERSPSVDGISAAPEVRALAEAYALLALSRATEIAADALKPQALDAWLAWYATTPDSPCIAICSTAQGDPVCKGCGRSFDEVQHWPALDPFEKRVIWHRITQEATAWRFNRYAERATR